MKEIVRILLTVASIGTLIIFAFLTACFALFGETSSIDWSLYAKIVGACAIGLYVSYLMRDKNENNN
jgi:hypothetical protein